MTGFPRGHRPEFVRLDAEIEDEGEEEDGFQLDVADPTDHHEIIEQAIGARQLHEAIRALPPDRQAWAMAELDEAEPTMSELASRFGVSVRTAERRRAEVRRALGDRLPDRRAA